MFRHRGPAARLDPGSATGPVTLTADPPLSPILLFNPRVSNRAAFSQLVGVDPDPP